MRLAGSPEVYEALSRRLSAGDVRAAQRQASEALDHRLDTFFQLYALLQSKGYSEPAAQQVALEMLEGRQPMAQMTRRFAAINGQQPPDAGDGGPTHRAL